MPITKKTPASTVIKDFEGSDNPRFAGKSKEERKKMALGAYYAKHPEKSNKNESLEFTFFEDGSVTIIGEDGQIFEYNWADHHELGDPSSVRRDVAKASVAAPTKPAEPKVNLPASKTTHLIKHPNGMTTPHVGDDASAHAAAAKVGGTVKKIAPMKESIDLLIKLFSEGDRVGATHLIEEILMEKVTPLLDAMKIVVAEKHFNLDEANKSSVRPDFDAEHATNLMMAQGGGASGMNNFHHNHFMYGVNSAHRKMKNGTYDDSKLDKMGENLSKLGKWRVETFSHKSDHKYMPTNAAEHREVGKHLADHIRTHLGIDPKNV